MFEILKGERFHGWFFGNCTECSKRRPCTNTTHTYGDGRKDETPKARCIFCIWKIDGRFKWRAWCPEDSKFYVDPNESKILKPSLVLDYRGNPVA